MTFRADALHHNGRTLNRIAKKLGIEIAQLSYEGHCRAENIDFWVTTQAWWDRVTGHRGTYTDIGELLAERLPKRIKNR
jgi:hypothetical protein